MKYSARLHDPIFAKRDVVLEKIDKFWPQALTNCVSTNVYIDDDDHALLDSVTKIAVKRDVNDPRAATIEFHFAPNDFIHDTVLVKEFKLDPKAGPFSAQFDFASETIPQPTTIQWKSDEKNLSKRKPTIGDLKEIKEGQEDAEDEEEEDDFEPGSFFSSFFDSQSRQVAGSIGQAIVEDLYPNAVQHYESPSLYEDEDDEDEDDEEDDEDEEDDDREIDLEEEEARPKKKSRK